MIISPWNRDITPCTDNIFIPEQLASTGMSKSRKKETDEIVP
jgi:hypothetical protein